MSIYPRSRKDKGINCERKNALPENLHHAVITEGTEMNDKWDCDNKLIFLSYKEGYVVITKGCATSAAATIQ